MPTPADSLLIKDDPGRVDNPYFAYAWVWIEAGTTSDTKGNSATNWVEVTQENGRPQRLLQFEFHRRMPGGNQCSVTLFDETWKLVESLIISASQNRMRWRYGYASGGAMSPLYEGVIIDYHPIFRIDGVEIQIEATSVPILQPLGGDQQKVRNFVDKDGKGMSISDIVLKIASENGWRAIVDSTMPYYGDDSKNASGKIPAIFQQSGQKDLDFIAQVLCPRAVRSPDGVSHYIFFVDDRVSQDGSFKPTLHFHPPHYNGEKTNVYTFMRDRVSEIISFSPDITGCAQLGLGAGSVTAFWIDHQTGEVGSTKVDNSNTPNKQILGGKITDATPRNDKTEDANLHATYRPVRNEDQARQEAEYNYIRLFDAIQGGQLVILGNPALEADTVITVNVILPDGSSHYTSGDYFVLNITDTISGGIFTTAVDLQRNSYLTPPKTKNGLGDLTQLAVGRQAQASGRNP